MAVVHCRCIAACCLCAACYMHNLLPNQMHRGNCTAPRHVTWKANAWVVHDCKHHDDTSSMYGPSKLRQGNLLQVMSCLRNDLSLEDCQPSAESCDADTLIVPSWNAMRLMSASREHVQQGRLQSDSQGCAISPLTCILPQLSVS